jgi:glucose/arabinose dehydrogenase
MRSLRFIFGIFFTGLVLAIVGGLSYSHAAVSTITASTTEKLGLDPDSITLAKGYRIEPVVARLSLPTTLIFEGSDMLVAESGFTNVAAARVLRIRPDGTVTVLASKGLEPPVTGLLAYNDRIYVSHRGKVSIIEADGTLRDIVTGLPSLGDHQNNQLALGPDGKIYLGQGTVTNSGVVGEDSYLFGWLKEHPDVHEVPCKDIALAGINFTTDNPLTEDKSDKIVTGAYKPFGASSTPGEVIPGNAKCGGSIVRFNPDGSGFELVAWGLRNPFGLEFAPAAGTSSSTLWAVYHGADVRGSRNIYNDPDYLVRVEKDAWYGWPEYFDGQPATAPRFKALLKPAPTMLWQTHPPLTKAFTTFDSHSAVNGIAFSNSDAFGFRGDLFVAAFGTFTPATTGTNVKLSGFRVIRVNMQTGEKSDFAKNILPGPAYLNGTNGFNRPADVTFGPDDALYVLDWGASKITSKGLEEVPATGAIWRIYPEKGAALRPNGPIIVPSDVAPESERKALVPNIPEAYKMLSPELLIFGLVILAVILVLWALIRAGRRRGRRRWNV